MELPSREKGDVLLPSGEMSSIRRRLRILAARHDLTTVIAYAFDHRTRILPFIYADVRMAPAGVRAIGSALVDCGFDKTRIVLQQWNPNFDAERMRLDGRIPDIFMVSSLQLHTAECRRLIAACCRIDPARRPLIIVGGPLTIYEPWLVFSDDPSAKWSADVAVTGEEYVVLQLLETLLSMRAAGESMRATFQRVRACGALDEIPGLVYGLASRKEGPVEELIDTGTQRLLGDLDESPSPVFGYQLLERPGRDAKLAPKPLPLNEVRRHSKVASIVLTMGCKFRCAYCPIPAYNQRTHRVKSGERVADDIEQIVATYGLSYFFGTDDNFFNDAHKALDITETLARRASNGRSALRRVRWGTEATVHDTVRLKDHLPVMRRSGLFAIWMGVEDLTGTLVKKGQSESKTLESFRLLRESGILPIPMMMHHDSQPLITRKNNYGLLNQLRVLRKAGALYTQVLMLIPAVGSKWYTDTYKSGQVFDSVNGREIPPYMVDGSYVVASKHPRPWIKQLNLLAGYAFFFNPLRMLYAVVASKSRIPQYDFETRRPARVDRYSRLQALRRRIYLKARGHLLDAGVQAAGMVGLYFTVRRTLPWAWQLLRGKIQRCTEPPASKIPMRSPSGACANHALPGTPLPDQPPQLVPLEVPEPPQTRRNVAKAA